MPDTHPILDAHNRLCLLVSSALGATYELSRLLALKGEVEEMLRLVNEVRNHTPILCITSTNSTQSGRGFHSPRNARNAAKLCWDGRGD